MLFSVVTPSFRASQWLQLCIPSVADQGVEVEHIVQDAGSDDGTLDWLTKDPRVRAYVEKDRGMYDAINRGLKRSRGEILAWLNCDEQYLAGALKQVHAFFESHPQVDVLFGDVVIVDAKGDYLYHRKVQVPLKYHTWTCHLSTLSCATFFRRRIVFDQDLFFDPNLRDVADGVWILELMRRKTRMAALGQFTSVFTQTGANMSAAPNARREARELFASAPVWAQKLKPCWIAQHRLRRWLGGMYARTPFSYDLYTPAEPARRLRKEVTQPQPVTPKR